MSFTPIIHVFQVIIAVMLIGAILLQVRGQDAGGVFGQQATVFRTRRGFEKTLFQATIAMAVVFVLLSVLAARFTA